MNSCVALSTTVALLLSPLSQANNDWYIGVDLEKSDVELSKQMNKINEISNGQLKDDGGGISVFTGYQYNNWLSLELGFSRQAFEVIDSSTSAPSYFGYEMLDVYSNSFSVSSKIRYLTNNGFSFHVKPGIAYTITEVEYNGGTSSPDIRYDYDQTNKNVHFNLEVGGEYFLNDSFSISLSYERKFKALDYSIKVLNSDEMSVNSYKGGVRYYF